MKKLLCIAVCVLGFAGASFAQKGNVALGLHVSNATEINQMGLGVKVQCFISDAIRIEPSFNYYFKKAGIDMWDVNANVHYVFNVADQFNVYPLAGLVFSHWSGASSFNRFGANLGAGAEYYFTEKIGMSAEVKYQFVKDVSQCAFSLGVNYKF
ncbi:MAG: porin family protein [Muribaculaceae bacterium]